MKRDFMPLTLITGVFGMNFRALPGQDQPWGFWVTLGCMAVVAAVLLLLFRHKRYIDSSDVLPGIDEKCQIVAVDAESRAELAADTGKHAPVLEEKVGRAGGAGGEHEPVAGDGV